VVVDTRASGEEPGRGDDPARACALSDHPRLVLSCRVLTLEGFVLSSVEAWVITEEELMDIRALACQGYTYAEIGRLVGRDWLTVKRYLEEGAQPVYRRKRMPSQLDPFKPLIDQWLAKEPRLLSTRVHQDLVRDYAFTGVYDTVRRLAAPTGGRVARVVGLDGGGGIAVAVVAADRIDPSVRARCAKVRARSQSSRGDRAPCAYVRVVGFDRVEGLIETAGGTSDGEDLPVGDHADEPTAGGW